MSQRIVVITGGTGALGRAVVAKFASAGDIVVPISRSSGDFAADLTQPGEAQQVLQRVVERHGGVDVLIHSMGAYAAAGTIAETPGDVWARMMATNFQSALYVCSSVVPHMTKRDRGRIVAVGSRAGVQPMAGSGAYNVSKAALHVLVQTLALELKNTGVTANVVLPSTIDTDANRARGPAEQATTWVKPESIADVIFWLASDTAADVNGALVPVYGRA
jgi:NAD(P)-dependent dehydrogenase (short-subunit alcohol dehydrogenase family)